MCKFEFKEINNKNCSDYLSNCTITTTTTTTTKIDE